MVTLLVILGAVAAAAAAYVAFFNGAARLRAHAEWLWRMLRRRPLGIEAAKSVLRPAYQPLPPKITPSVLLQATYDVVPFHGRHEELRQLSEWCERESDLELALWVGAGGSGKSRLACELCRVRSDWKWVAGFLPDRASRDDYETLAAAPEAVLVVVDYAESRPEDVVALVEAFADAKRTRAARILLLARYPGDWWTDLSQDVNRDAGRARIAIESAEVRGLEELASTDAARVDVFERACKALSQHLGGEPASAVLEDASNPVYRTPLFLHLAAVSALDPWEQPATGRLREDLLAGVLSREARIWRETAEAAGLEIDRHTRARAVAVASLTVAEDESEAVAALEAVPELAGEAHRAVRHKVARWLHDLYPGERWLRPLEPDLLAEALVAEVLADVPQLASSLLASATEPQISRLLTVLGRSAHDYEHAALALQRALAENLARVAEQVIAVAPQVGDPLGAIAAAVLEQHPDAGLAAGLLPVFPEETISLREFKAVAVRQALGAASSEAEAAGLSIALAVQLAALGDVEEAHAAAEKGVRLYRRLSAARPEIFHPDLAISLNNLSNHLAELGHREQALGAIEEAVAIRRDLASANPEAFRPDLAMSLNNLSIALGELGRREEALVAIEEAVAIRRDLASANPEAFRPDLAMSLNNLSIRFAALGLREQALAAIDEAVTSYRSLSGAHPDAFRSDLATSLNNLSNHLAELGRREEALAAIEEAVALDRELASARPAAFRADLATSLNNLSIHLAELGRDEEALAAIEEAVAIRHALAGARPDAFRADLAGSLNNLSNRLAKLGHQERALAAIERAVTIRRELAAARPDAFRPDLGTSLNNLSNRLATFGHREPALAATEEAVGLYRQLAAAYPEAYGPDLAGSLNNLSNRLTELDRPEPALAAIEEAVALYRNLASAQPDAFRVNLAGSLDNLARCLAAVGRDDDSAAVAEEAAKLAEPVAPPD